MIEAVTAITYATATARRAGNFLRYEIYGEPDDDLRCDFACWVIQTDNGVVLFDTGFTAAAAAPRGQTIVADVPAALREFGIEPEDVGTIVLSHLHYDHMGSLEHFPDAEVYLQRAEYEFWQSPLADRLQFALLRESAYLDQLKRIDQAGRLRLLDGDTQIVPGINSLLLGGHTVGTQALVISDPRLSREIVLAADAVHYHDELDRDMPFAVVADLPAMYRAFDRLREMEERGATIIPGHDARTVESYPSRTLRCGAIVTDLLGT